MAFENCKFKGNQMCGYCGSSQNIQYCGVAHGENKISELKHCPQDKTVKKEKKGRK